MAPTTEIQNRDIVDDFDHFAGLDQYTGGLDGVDQATNYLFVHILLGSFVALCLLTLGYRWAKMASAHIRHLTTAGAPSHRQTFFTLNRNPWWPAIKKHLAYAPLFNKRHNQELKLSAAVNVGTLPSRYHTLLLVLYVVTNFAYCLVLPWDLEESAAVIAAFRGRTGVLAALNLIPTVLFALRNNPLIPLLRVSYDTFNLLHRWAARLVIVEGLLHTVAWAVNEHKVDGFAGLSEELRIQPSYAWGLVSTICMVIISVQAWSPVRHAFYETFLNIHRLMAFFAILGAYLHIDLHHLPQLPWMQLVAVIWGLEWIARTARILYYNVSPRQVTRVTVEALPGEASRVTFDMVRPWNFRPGCHVHAYLPRLALWSSHPFSIAWVEKGAEADASAALAKVDNEKLPTTNDEVIVVKPDNSHSRISLVVRVCTGFTKTLHEKAKAAPDGRFTTWGAIEGPYGGHDSLKSYGTVLLFAAGVGITHQVGFVKDLVQSYQDGTAATRKVVLVWSVPTTDCLEWVRPWMDEILRMPARREVLKVLLYVTKPRSHGEITSGTGMVRMHPGRVKPAVVLDQEFAGRVGAMAVTVCGPGVFADSVRDAVRQRVDYGALDFIEEAFTY
ncbi:putative rerric reductase like transmembrane component [Lineolata rhizophorae]|uniref:Putative rerric reductase like transmembrane component n=1 Tax=Lineolata rhizophorae TaxID=578093 RepID=A0A6A6PD32_9PEZI|nr:putative rerric reductase like transmembrane component [Lineolata rhizophorae]